MGFPTRVLERLRDPRAAGLDVESEDSIRIHREIIESKPLLRATYSRWYRECARVIEETRGLGGGALEVGCGAGFLERFVPDLIKTDSVANPFAHRVMDAARLDFADGSLRNIFLIDVLHHLRDPEKFLEEAQRCLRRGGRLVMIEPNNCALARFLCKSTNHYEIYDGSSTGWENPDAGRLLNANLALPWIIFVRDRGVFEKKFPGLRIKAIRRHTFLSYYLSGGLSFRSLLPASARAGVALLEWLAGPFMGSVGSMMTIDIERV